MALYLGNTKIASGGSGTVGTAGEATVSDLKLNCLTEEQYKNAEKNENELYLTPDDGTTGSGISLLDVYPVGSIYTSVNSTDPSSLFGGTWERIQGYFLLAANDKYAEYQAGKIGGSVSHTHTSAAHSHGYGSLYTAMWNAGNVGHYYRTKTGVSFTANEIKKDTGVGATSSKASTEGIQVYGNTGSTTPGNTGSSSNMPPFLSVYMWKRIS